MGGLLHDVTGGQRKRFTEYCLFSSSYIYFDVLLIVSVQTLANAKHVSWMSRVGRLSKFGRCHLEKEAKRQARRTRSFTSRQKAARWQL
eukprot:2370281-Amphidinium_carterae.1